MLAMRNDYRSGMGILWQKLNELPTTAVDDGDDA